MVNSLSSIVYICLMIEVVFPKPSFKIERRDENNFIFDSIRKQWIVLTDEEWVRQNFIRFLVQEMKYPETLIAVEKEIQLGELKKRFDILVYNNNHQPWMLVECKAGNVALDKKVFEQVLRYHISVSCTFLLITNGQYTFGWEKTGGALREIEKMPEWV
jgi:hypothetical protein